MTLRAALAALLLSALAAAQVAPPEPAPEPLPGEPRCGFCGTTGRTPFEVDGKLRQEQEAGRTWKVDFCSLAHESDNMGLTWAPCARCKTPSLQARAQKEWDLRKAAGDAWLAERRRVDKVAGAEKPLVHVQTTHFLVVWNVPRITTPDKKNHDAHEAAHLYARRLEEFYARFQEMFGITDRNNMQNRHTLMVFEEHEQALQAGPPYTMLQGLPTVKRAGGAKDDSVVVTWWDKGEFPKETDMWRHQLHSMSHQFTSVYYDIAWFKPGEIGLSPPWLNDKFGWIDEGLAHWFEIDYDKRARTFCTREQNVESRWGGDDWRKNIYKAVSAGDIPAFAEVITKPTPSLTAKEHQFAWSWVDFLLARDTAAMGKAMRLAKMKRETRDILKESWGLSVIEFESAWSAWVLENYAPTKK